MYTLMRMRMRERPENKCLKCPVLHPSGDCVKSLEEKLAEAKKNRAEWIAEGGFEFGPNLCKLIEEEFAAAFHADPNKDLPGLKDTNEAISRAFCEAHICKYLDIYPQCIDDCIFLSDIA
jgi:hypothetical protein